jgi:hypothetical protein
MRLQTTKPAPVLMLHTKLPELYRSKIERLAEALNAPDTVAEAAETMRGLIDRIVLTPEGGILRTELHGDLAVLACFAEERNRRAESRGDSALRLSVVAGARNHLNLLLTATSCTSLTAKTGVRAALRCDLFPGINYGGNGLDQTLPKTEIEQLDIGIHAELGLDRIVIVRHGLAAEVECRRDLVG